MEEEGKACLTLYFAFLWVIFQPIAAIIMTIMTNIMNGPTQLSVDG